MSAGYMLLGGTGYLSSADKAAYDITGDLDIISCSAADDWSPVGDGWLLSKWEASNRSYGQLLKPNSTIQIPFTEDGTNGTFPQSNTDLFTEITGLANGDPLWLRTYLDVSNGSSVWEAHYYYSLDPISTPVGSVSWTALGATDTGGAAITIFSGGAALKVGANNTGANLFIGKVFGVWLYSGIPSTPGDPPSGTLIADPDFRTTWTGTDGQGNSWTSNGDAAWVPPTARKLYSGRSLSTRLLSTRTLKAVT